MTKVIKILIVVVLAGGLILLRSFEDVLFYDPLINFFKTNHSIAPLPELDMLALLGNTALRFLLNTLFSLGIIWIVFKNRDILKLSALLYCVVFILLLGLFWYLLSTSEAGNYMSLFYVRRFLIQPIFLLILLPAFYFQKTPAARKVKK